MAQKVKIKERLEVALRVSVPDVNRAKSYKALDRKYNLVIDGIPTASFDQESPRSLKFTAKLRSLIEVRKVYGSKRPDSIYTYRVGENFAEITNQVGKSKRVAIDFSLGNLLTVEDDISFNNLVDIR